MENRYRVCQTAFLLKNVTYSFWLFQEQISTLSIKRGYLGFGYKDNKRACRNQLSGAAL